MEALHQPGDLTQVGLEMEQLRREYQPRFIAYALAHGKTPDEMLTHDKARWPGGCMCGFILWISAKWGEWSREFKRDPHNHTPEDHAHFDAWLARAAVAEVA